MIGCRNDGSVVGNEPATLPKNTFKKFVQIFLRLNFSRDCVLEQDVVIGSGSSVGTGSVIRNSVIGKHCVIGIDLLYKNALASTWYQIIIV